MAGKGRVRVAAVNDYVLIVAGLARLLSQFPDQLDVCDRVVVGDPIELPSMWRSTTRMGESGSLRLRCGRSPKRRGFGHVAMFSLDLTPDLIAEGRSAGATGFISKGLSGAEIADATATSAEMRAASVDAPVRSY